MNNLPDADELFLRFFNPWYSDADRKRKGFPATRPDLAENKKLTKKAAADLSPLNPEGQAEVKKMIAMMLEAAQGDWPKYLKVTGEPDITWIKAFDEYFDTSHVSQLIDRSNPAEFGNPLLVTTLEFGSVLGFVMQRSLPSLEWIMGWPYWESSLFNPEKGQVVAVFHWAIKKMSSYGIDDGFESKTKACLQFLQKMNLGDKKTSA